MRTGTTNAFTGQNRCGAAHALTTTEQYLGTSTKAAEVSAKGACTGNDGVSVTSWGALPTTTLAYTWTYYRPSNATMSPTTGPCDVSKRLLAAGDLAGMKSLYAK